MRGLGLVSALALTASLSGCSAFCVEMGFGLGAGAAVEVPVIMHTGFHLGGARYFGWGYDRGLHGPDRKLSNTTLVIYHSEEERIDDGPWKDKHSCFAMFLPLLFDLVESNRAVESTGLEVTVSALLVSFRLGFNPGYWFADEPVEPAPTPEDPEERQEGDAIEEDGPTAASETRGP